MKRFILTILISVIAVNCFANDLKGWEVRKVGGGEWIAAKVPGTVAASYCDAGLLEDIRYDDNLSRIDDAWYISDFEYRTTFAKPESVGPEDRVILNFDGISWKADVTLNGEPVGRIEGSFIRSHFDITNLLKENNELKVLIHRQDNPGEVKIPTLERNLPNGGVLGLDNPCFHASIGWDWIPTVPGRNIGIWNDVYLTTAYNGLIIEDAFFDTVLDKKYYPGTEVKKPEFATINPTITFNNFSGEPQETTVEVTFGALKKVQKVTVPVGRNDVGLDAFRLDEPELWWPVGYGKPYLYDVKVKAGGAEKSLKVGVRQMFYTIENNALQMYINGRRYVPKGGNWGFSEVNLDYSLRNYRIALKFHKLQNFNMVRNWVGQIGDEEFYEACDEAGVMVWQDFWLANPGDGPNPSDEKMFIKNADDMVHKVRPHASLALFCARNEGIAPRGLELYLNRIVTDLCPNTIFLPNSSEYFVSGQGPYRIVPPVNYFANRATAPDGFTVGDNKLHGERGMPCIPSYESICRMLRPEHRWPQNDVWAMHNFTLKGAQHCETLNAAIAKGFGAEPSSLEEFADHAQYIDFITLRAMYESRSSHRNGLLIWMSHPAWPCFVFQTYDYYFDVNGGVYGAKKGAAPLRIQWNPLLERIEVVNDCYGDLQGLTAQVTYLDIAGKVLSDASYKLDSGNDTTIGVCPFEAPAGQDVFYIKLKLSKDGEVLADNFYWEGSESGAWPGIPAVSDKTLKTVYAVEDGYVTATVTNNGEYVVPLVRVDLLSKPAKAVKKVQAAQVLPSFYEDNYFALLPGESRTIRIEYLSDEHTGENLSVSARSLRH